MFLAEDLLPDDVVSVLVHYPMRSYIMNQVLRFGYQPHSIPIRNHKIIRGNCNTKIKFTFSKCNVARIPILTNPLAANRSRNDTSAFEALRAICSDSFDISTGSLALCVVSSSDCNTK